jgi:hypothetical protein
MQTIYKAQRKGKEFIQGKIDLDYQYNQNFITTLTKEGNKKEEAFFHGNYFYVYCYNEKGLITESHQTYNNNDSMSHKTEYIYNDKNLNTERITRKLNGKVYYRSVNNYNEFGQMLEATNYLNNDDKEIITSRTVYTYSEHVDTVNNITYKKPLTIEQYKGDGTLESRTTYTYDERGYQIENNREHFLPEQIKYGKKFTYKRNKQGDVIETNYYRYDGSLESTSISSPQYDSDGKKIIEHTPQEEDTLETEAVETDSRGNWIKKTIYYNKIPRMILIRELVYEGEEKTLIHPISNSENMENKTTPPKHRDYEMDLPDAKWLVEAANATTDSFSFLRYYVHHFKEHPSLVFYQGPYIEALVMLDKLKEEHDAVEVHSYSIVGSSGDERIQRYTLTFPNHSGYLLHAIGISPSVADQFNVPPDLQNRDDDYYVYFSSFQFLRPSEVSGNRDEYFEQVITELMEDCTLQKKPELPMINIIEVKGSNYSISEYPVNDNFIIKDLDVNYGHGFEKFHNDLMQRFNSSTKGLVLFHGQPGTGKTFYIRHLLRKMVSNRKNVIYIPPNMVDHLVDPMFMTFLSGELREWGEGGQTCVLLIEDAEPLLAKREEGVRIQGVTNLLNMTDGLLNDMLNIQIICTFNVDLQKLDSALLRPGRLIARKEFKALSVLDANLLAQRLGIKHHFKKPATLGEIYAMRKNHDTLVHDVEQDKGASKAIDDL